MEETTLKEEMRLLREQLAGAEQKKKQKKFKIPPKARLKNRDLMKGYVTVQVINENGAVDFVKEPIIDSTIKLNDTTHAIDAEDILTYKGKPLIIQSKIKSNPWNPNNQKNETYGQKHIMSRMMNEVIEGKKKKLTVGMSIGLLIILGIIVYALIAG